jgi:hypothetical protein
MPDPGPKMRSHSSVYSVVITGSVNSAFLPKPGALRAYSSYSYTVCDSIQHLDAESIGARSRPLNPGAVRALNSVLHSRVPESAILRDEGGEL